MITILVVDDDPDTCMNMSDVLNESGYTAHFAQSGDAALEKVRQHPYAIGLLDLRMPGMDGLTLCRRLKQLSPNMATLIITGYPHEGLEQEACAAGARLVVIKPINFARLLGLVEKTLASNN